MSYRKIVNFLVFIISILTVNLLTTYITDKLFSYKNLTHPVKATLIGMGLTVFILYPAFMWIDDLSEKLTKRFLKAGKNAGGKVMGLILMFLLALAVLFAFYLHMWFGVMPWDFR